MRGMSVQLSQFCGYQVETFTPSFYSLAVIISLPCSQILIFNVNFNFPGAVKLLMFLHFKQHG